VSLLRGGELDLDADVELLRAGSEPDAAARGESRWLGDLVETEQLAKEAARLGLATGRAGKLNVIYADNPRAHRGQLGRSRSGRGYARRLTGEGSEIRRCRPDDVQAVLELWAQERSGHASTSDRAVDVERLIAADSPAALLVAERDGVIVGVLIAAWDGWRGNMYRLAVHREHRRRGIALALTRAGEEYMRGRGVRRVTALVAYDDEPAEGFWEAVGYPLDREIGRRVRNV